VVRGASWKLAQAPHARLPVQYGREFTCPSFDMIRFATSLSNSPADYTQMQPRSHRSPSIETREDMKHPRVGGSKFHPALNRRIDLTAVMLQKNHCLCLQYPSFVFICQNLESRGGIESAAR
jgi:hypothetical protein